MLATSRLNWLHHTASFHGRPTMAALALVLIVAAFTLLYYIATKRFKDWKKAGVKCITPPTIRGAIRGTFLNGAKDMYTCYPGEPYIGIIRLHSNAVCVRDPDLIRLILTKDFTYFHDRGMRFNENRNVLSLNLFNIEGKRWKILRSKLTPTFTSGKLRAMFPLVEHCVYQMTDIVSSSYADTHEAVDLNDFLSRCTTDIILSCAFGLQGNCLNDEKDIYLQMVKKTFRSSPIKLLEHIFFSTFPYLENFLPPLKEQKEINKFFFDAFSATLRDREKSGVKRNDFLDLLIEIQKNGKLTDRRTENDDSDSSFDFTYNVMVAQAFVFFIAGSETSSSTASFTVVELANNIHIQDKLRAEIDESIQRHGRLTYDGVMSMTYLDQVISETLRKYPPLKVLTRTVTQPYLMPDGRVTLPKGMRVYVHIGGLHMDPQYFPDPDKFDPERFSPEAKQGMHKYVYMPFGEGPRICIGMRFAFLQVKLALAVLLCQFELHPKPGIPYPPVISNKSLVTAFVHGATVLITRRK